MEIGSKTPFLTSTILKLLCFLQIYGFLSFLGHAFRAPPPPPPHQIISIDGSSNMKQKHRLGSQDYVLLNKFSWIILFTGMGTRTFLTVALSSHQNYP